MFLLNTFAEGPPEVQAKRAITTGTFPICFVWTDMNHFYRTLDEVPLAARQVLAADPLFVELWKRIAGLCEIDPRRITGSLSPGHSPSDEADLLVHFLVGQRVTMESLEAIFRKLGAAVLVKRKHGFGPKPVGSLARWCRASICAPETRRAVWPCLIYVHQLVHLLDSHCDMLTLAALIASCS